MALEVEEVLSLWREAERLLDGLPADAPERGVVSAQVVSLKQIYSRLTAGSDATDDVLADSHSAVVSAQTTLEAAKRGLVAS